MSSNAVRSLLFVVFAVSVVAQTPSIRTSEGVLSAASFAYSGLPNGGIPQGSLFAIFGDNLGPAQLVEVTAFPLPTTAGLAGTSVAVTVNGTTVNAIMIYTVKTQVAAVLPSNTPVGTGTLTVTYNGQTSNAVPIHVVAGAFGIYAVNQAGSGPGIIQNFESSGDVVNAVNQAAQPGQVEIIWGTGLGPVSGDEAGGVLPGDMPNLDVHVFVGTMEAPIQYRGRSGCCVGDDQIVFTVPAGIEGCHVPVSVVLDGVVSNYVTMAISSSGNTCTDPNGYTASQLQLFLNNPSVKLSSMVVSRGFDRNMSSVGYQAGGAPYRDDAIEAVYENYPSTGFLNGAGQPPIGTCEVTQVPGAAPPNVGFLDGGVLTETGPVGPRTIFKSSTGVYQIVFSPVSPSAPNVVNDGTVITAGTYSFNSTAGSQVGAYATSINHPATFSWNEFSGFPATIDRTKPLTLTWTGGTAGAMINIFGKSAYASGPVGDMGAQFQCLADGGAGSFTIPASVLSALPATFSGQAGAHGSFSFSQYIFGTPPTIPGIDISTISAADIFSIFGETYQ